MGCKSCKSKKMGEKISSEFTKTSSYVNDSLHQRKMEILKKSWDTSMGSFKLSEKIVGENPNSKISRLIKIIKKRKIDYLFVSSGENVCWLLNIL